jgi:signal transduction histidine kinase
MNAPETGADKGDAAGAGAGHDPSGGPWLRQLAEEQAALRRVATLVAGGARPAEVFSAVADELGRLIGAEVTFVSRFDELSGERGEIEGYATVVGSYGRVSEQVPVGFRRKLEPGMAMTAALRTAGPARITGDMLASGPFGDVVRGLGLRAAMAMPIVVEGRYWGVAVAATARADFPAGTEVRMADFTELAAAAIANAQAEEQLRELVGTQAALRRLATLVAQGEPPEAVFAAATREALWHFGSGTARMIRFELDGTATLVANEGTTGPHVRVGERWEGYPPTGLTATVLRTGQAARVEDYREVPGGERYLREGLRSAVAMPIHVNGRLWGLIAVGSGQGPLPLDTEQRMSQFTDLVATAVGNAQNQSALEASRDELAASRARIVAAADETRRRIERDLHDGTQQRLVSLGLELRLAQSLVPAGLAELETEIGRIADELGGVVEDLREIARGIHPAILSEGGLVPALRTLARRAAIKVELEAAAITRLPEPVEVVAYYTVSEALTNATKHAQASVVSVVAGEQDDRLCLSVRDDGIGGADPARGSGLIGLRDRVEALGGSFEFSSLPGQGTLIGVRLPLRRH